MEPKYGDPTDCCDLRHNTMSISLGNFQGQKSHTVYWNDGINLNDPKIGKEIGKITDAFNKLS